jgi:hypothetical protein
VVVVPAINIDIAAVGDTTDNSAGVWINRTGVWINRAGVWINRAGVWINHAGVWINHAGVWTNRDRRRQCHCDGEKGACGCAAEFFDVRDSDSCINTATRERAKQDFTEPVT